MSEAPETTRPLTWVDDDAGLAAHVSRINAAPSVAFDTEANSMHAYRERVCLLQVTLPDGEDAVIDPLAVDPAPLAEPLGNERIVKIMHGADYDVLSLQRQYAMTIRNLFDTNIAARVLQWERRGLGALLEEHFGFHADKKMQRFDWGRRPLPRSAIEYARYDTHWLHALAEIQTEALAADPARQDVFAHACLRQAAVMPRPITTGADPWRIKGFAKLPSAVQARAAALAELREELAADLDQPLFKVIPDDAIVGLARSPPADAAAVSRIRRLHPRVRRTAAARILAAIAAGDAAGPPARPSGPGRPPAEVTARFDALRGWRKDTAAARGLEPDLVLPKAALWALAESDPASEAALAAVDELDDWERDRFGRDLLGVLAKLR